MKTLAIADVVKHKNNMNIIRLIAACSVIFGHAYPIMGNQPDPTAIFFGSTNHFIGDMAVDIFFSISGFLLAMSAAKGVSIVSFIIARVLRIYPALIACNLVVIITCWGYFNSFSKDFIHNQQTISYLINNSTMWFTNATDFARNDWLPNSFTNVRIGFVDGSLWTLISEIKAYVYMICILFALDVLLAKRSTTAQGIAWICMIIFCLFFFEYLPLVGSEPKFKHHFIFFFIGALSYAVRNKIPLSAVGAIIMVLCVWVAKFYGPSIFSMVIYIAYPYIVLYLAYGVTYSRILNEFGDFSYGIYIYGWFVANLIAASIPTASPLTNFQLSIVGSFMLAIPSWFLVEKPALSLRDKFRTFKSPLLKPEAQVS